MPSTALMVPQPDPRHSEAADPALVLLRRHFGHDRFRPAQRAIIGAALAGRDVLAVLPTGAGKSVCFQIPALLRDRPTIVVSPLIALMQDQVESARGRGVPAAFINSTLDAGQQSEVLEGVRAGRVRLLYAAPERLARLASELADLGIRPGLLAVDEAHCISEWGHDFRPTYRTLRRARAALGWPQAIALTGSATPTVRADIRLVLGLDRGRHPCVEHLASFDRPNLRFDVLPVAEPVRRLRELHGLLRADGGSAIVYVPTRNLAEALARILRRWGIRSAPYHAGLHRDRRRDTLDGFLADRLRVVAATCAFGMGIDKPDVRLVAHWLMPATPEAYYQEAGRAGRDGGPARCVMLHHPGDGALHRRMLSVTFPPEPIVEAAWQDRGAANALPRGIRESVERLRGELRPDQGPVAWDRVRRRKRQALERLRAVERYATARGCRRRILIGWFGERLATTPCSGCDRCQGRARWSLRNALAPGVSSR